MQADFERELSKRIRTRRLIIGCLALIFLALFMTGWIMLEATKDVIIRGGPAPIPTWEHVDYNEAYIPLIVLSMAAAVCCGVVLLVDFVMCGHRTIRKDLHCITLYRGLGCNIVYVDGQEKGRIGPFSHTHVVETWLPNRIRVTVSFSRVFSYIAHVSFSDDTASREV